MVGETSQSEVTRESYPDLFELHDQLKARGIESEPRPFDRYQGPFLNVPALGVWVWYANGDFGPEPAFVIEKGFQDFETYGANYRERATATELEHGVYYAESAAKRIAQLSRKATTPRTRKAGKR